MLKKLDQYIIKKKKTFLEIFFLSLCAVLYIYGEHHLDTVGTIHWKRSYHLGNFKISILYECKRGKNGTSAYHTLASIMTFGDFGNAMNWPL